MRLRRGPLFWGLLLITMGAIPLLVRGGYLEATWFAEAWRLWPLILVAIGLSIMLGRGRAGALGTVVLALVIGLIGGGLLASGGFVFGGITDCAARPGSMSTTTDTGAFTGDASVTLDLDCGAATIGVVDSDNWSLTAAYRNRPPDVTATGATLRVTGPPSVRAGRQEWTLDLAAATTRTIGLRANAAASVVTLAGADLDRFQADLNAGDLRLDARGGAVGRLDVTLNAGRARIALGSGAVTGSLSANAGALELCVSPDVGLSLRVKDHLTFGHNLSARGLVRSGETWTRPGATGATIELAIEGNAASLTLDPEGGC
jgi:Domain of unknown function (DUF5668)